MTENVSAFLTRYGMLDPGFDILACAEKMCAEMEKGLCGEQSSYPMIPTYLSPRGEISNSAPVAVIDAGGTNFRSALVHFEDGHCLVEHVRKTGMPGIASTVSWEEFIAFTADQIEDFMPLTDRIGFCFSYSAEITPEIDGKVIRIDKEVTISGCEGKLVGASLSEELKRRGYPGKRVFVLNDTAAVQLGGMAKHLREHFGECFGQVSGTGTNTCLSIRGEQIKKLGDSAADMIINMESGMYDGLAQGQFDRELDRRSHNPGQKRFEKMTAGVYLGELCHLALQQAAEDELLSPSCVQKIRALPPVDSMLADAWAEGERTEELDADSRDAVFISELCSYLFRRSARFMCANLTAMALLSDAGLDSPAVIYAEGSLVQKNRIYQEELKQQLNSLLRERLKWDIRLEIESDTTLPGAAAAALIN